MFKNPVFLLVGKGWQHAREHRARIVFYVFLFALAMVMELAEPYVIGRLLNDLQNDLTGHSNLLRLLNHIAQFALLYFGIAVFYWAFHWPARFIEKNVAYHIRNTYKARTFQQVTELPLKWHREHHSGENIDKINRASMALYDFFEAGFVLIYMVTRLLGIIVILFSFMPMAGCCALAASFLACLNIAMFDNYLSKQYDRLNEAEHHTASAFHDYMSNIVSVLSLRLESRTLSELETRLGKPMAAYKSQANLNECKWAITSIIIAALTGIVLYTYAHTTIAHGTPLLAGTIISLFEYLRRLGLSFNDFASYYGKVVRQSADVRTADSIESAHAKLFSHKPLKGRGTWQTIHVRDLSFAYEDADGKQRHLDNVSIELRRGQAIALVGSSGGGKSTLLNLLRGLDHPSHVDVYRDGSRLEKGLGFLSDSTTLMPQDPEIFSDTVRFNIAFGMEASDAEINEAIKLARFDSVIDRLPRGLDTNIAEKGINLSGGEKQRLALARGIFFAKGSDLILLDEPTSSVDATNERMIYVNLIRHFRKSCLVSSIHRLHLLELFDVIYLVDRGRVVETGDFNALLARNGKLAELWRNYCSSSQPVQVAAAALAERP